MKTPVILTLNYFMFSMSHFSILDIFDNDTYDGLMQRARRLSLEEAEEIDGQPCDHVRLIVSGEVPPGFKQSIDNISDERERESMKRSYTNKRIALDFWITQGDRPLLKKVHSTEKFPEGGRASVKILFEQWELDVAVPDDLFLLKEIDQKE